LGLELKEQNELIKGCIEGNRSAQYAFYKKYSKAMYNISYRITNDPDEAEDVLQEAFLSAFNHMNAYKGDASIGAWLKRIVVNTAINHLRKKKMIQVPLEQMEVVEEDTINDEDIVLELSRVKDAIQELPDGFRTVFSLYLLEGYDHREIADILGVSESTSKSQYNRAKKRLKEILKERIYING
jgi:RNA polymerase sigma-70 factor (ECF subfamily)